MIRAGVGLALAASTYHVAAAILIGAQIRSGAMNFLGYPGLAGIDAIGRSLRITRYLSGGSERLIVIGPIPIRSPLPHISRHVVEAVAVRGKRADGRGP